MAQFPIALEGANIVVKGAFGPTMFSPAWFKETELLGGYELAEPQVEVVSPEITALRLHWLRFQATPDSLQFATEEVDEIPRLRDIAVGVLRILTSSPVGAVGINRETHTVIGSREALDRIGDVITPKAIWDGLLDFAGMRTVTMMGARADGWSGSFNVKVEPSLRVENAVYVSTNDHVELLRSEAPTARDKAFALDGDIQPSLAKREDAIEFLSSEWQAAMQRATRAHQHVTSMSGVSQ